MDIAEYIEQVKTSPETLEFNDLMSLIEAHYDFTPAAFSNGDLQNAADQNQGSCKLFAFAQLNGLSKEQTLACFGAFYREDVLQNPDADNHQNIRNFMQNGWDGIQFSSNALEIKAL
ncbi:HopJ type III effector protein [Cocleimonas sp. KMM 6892]|uniref:HopJ type III effector protein n=1 Tax=unclassified Cocleimonas TaxID=2639732 RepID=UPI002DBCFB9D|nr:MULTISPECIES: HopJ type III effector protein [unclassified Cocleimonas]MEB8433894.1 HopJ type III effector protein [Cocleimonas sp. KMM 6892]MEC4716705.1 HopJ type III effector protein [Cocleimonas sp. KMM 6895]MEC4746140.1 HopJ type III effector protein [Cocleimonas sp. KMM 6896]